MCGIAGIYAYRVAAPPVDRDELLRIREHMARRGPDGEGMWLSEEGRVGLAHRRLAIIDLSEAGAQPMASADGRFRVTFNGEIYNYRELRRELEGKAFVFRTQSDTEVLLHLYADRGERMVDALRGMFAFAVWDEAKRGMFLARDPFGIKPLYYSDDGATVRVASQVKALLAGGAIERTEDPAGYASFLLLGSVADPYTLFRQIRALPAGSSLWIDARGVGQARQFYRIADEFAAAEANPREMNDDELAASIGDALRASVRRHLVSDVPVGLFLSSGIDSSTLLGMASEEGASNLQTVTLGFREYQNTDEDETPLAEVIAHRYGARHRTRWIGRVDFEQCTSALLDAMDQPSIDGVNSYLVAKVAAEEGMKVALSGLGGDELFGGYPSFGDVPRMKRWLGWGQRVPALGRAFRRATDPAFRRFTSPKLAGLVEYGGSFPGAYLLRRGLYMPWELDEVMGAERARAGLDALHPLLHLGRPLVGLRRKRAIVATLEMEWYMRCQLLRDADWAGMAHSLEIRVPFVDVDLLRTLAPMLVSRRPPLKRHVGRIVSRALPSSVLERSKTGFTTPVREWSLELYSGQRPERGLRGWARFVLRRQRYGERKALISTLVPGHGGVATMTRKAIEILTRRGYSVSLAYYMPYRLAPALSVPFWQLGWKRPSVRNAVAFDNVHSFEIGVRLPELEWVRCFPSRLWKRIVPQFDYHIAVSGSALAALPILFQKRPCLAWVATPYLEDKIDRARRFPWYRRIVDALFDSPICRRLERIALRDAAVLALSDYTASALRAHEPCVRQTTMPMPIDATLFFPAHDTAPEPRNRIGFAGRFADPRKNITLLFDAVAVCRDRGFAVTCNLVGDEPRPEFGDYLRIRGLSDSVAFLGFHERRTLRDYYGSLDMLVIPSRQEGLGIVGLEAMACGCPVVATRCGGTEDYVKDGINGYLVGFSAVEMADAIMRILSDPSLRQSLRAGALETVRRDYSEAGVESVFWRQFDSAFGQDNPQ